MSALRIVRTDLSNVLAKVCAKCEPESNRELLEDGCDTRVVGGLRLFENPSNESNAYRYWYAWGQFEHCADRLQGLLQFLRRVKAWGCQRRKTKVLNSSPAPKNPNAPAAVTAAAISAVAANAIGANIIGLLISGAQVCIQLQEKR